MPPTETPAHITWIIRSTRKERSTEKIELIGQDRGSIYWTEMQAGAKGRHRPLPEERAAFARLEVQARNQARPAWRAVGHANVGLRQPAAREAEAPPHLRDPRAAVPPVFRGGRAAPWLDGHQLAAAPRIAARQRRLSDGLRLDSRRSAPARHARLDHRQRQGPEHSVGDRQ